MSLLGLCAACAAAYAGPGGYTQEFLMDGSGQGSALYGPSIDWRGDYYFAKRNVAGTESYIFKNHSPGNQTVPFITIPGRIVSFNVTPDRDTMYLYYKLDGRSGLYRLPLSAGAANPEYREFQIDESEFLFESFSLAEDPNQFFLMSPYDSALNVTVGLFSFDGGTAPSKVWTCSLPQEWKSNYRPVGVDDLGYHITYEASTQRLWLIVNKTYQISSSRHSNLPHWFFTRRINETGELQSYDPAEEIPGWNEGNFRLFMSRYWRAVIEFIGNGLSPDAMSGVKIFDPVAREFDSSELSEWTDANGEVRPIREFFEIDNNSYTWGGIADAQKNIYMTNKRYPSGSSSWDATGQRFARFSSAESVETPLPEPSAVNKVFTDADNITLQAQPFSGPAGYRATGSAWRVYALGRAAMASEDESTLIHEGRETGAGASHKLPAGVITGDGEYAWQMSYDWEYSSSYETQSGATNWSALALFSVAEGSGGSGTDNGNGGGGGCSAGTLGYAGLIILTGFVLTRKMFFGRG
jgi:hypothetical protein